jgi:hypothetical protein
MVSNRAFACVGAIDDSGVKLCVFVFRIKVAGTEHELEGILAEI